MTLAGAEPVNPEAVRYLNRLSDWLFVAPGSRTTAARATCSGFPAPTADAGGELGR